LSLLVPRELYFRFDPTPGSHDKLGTRSRSAVVYSESTISDAHTRLLLALLHQSTTMGISFWKCFSAARVEGIIFDLTEKGGDLLREHFLN